MGMDYKYAGSASYPRFDEELCEVANIFGGVKTDYLKSLENDYNKADWVTRMWGTISADCSENVVNEKFIFPSKTPNILKKFFNNPYDDFDTKETFEIWKNIKKHPEIKKISYQIWNEFETLTAQRENWWIN